MQQDALGNISIIYGPGQAIFIEQVKNGLHIIRVGGIITAHPIGRGGMGIKPVHPGGAWDRSMPVVAQYEFTCQRGQGWDLIGGEALHDLLARFYVTLGSFGMHFHKSVHRCRADNLVTTSKFLLFYTHHVMGWVGLGDISGLSTDKYFLRI